MSLTSASTVLCLLVQEMQLKNSLALSSPACCSDFFASFYLLLLLLGLVGPRVVLLLFWHMRNNSSSTECSSRGWSRAQTLRTLSGRGCLLQLVDALGGFIPCVFLFQVRPTCCTFLWCFGGSLRTSAIPTLPLSCDNRTQFK